MLFLKTFLKQPMVPVQMKKWIFKYLSPLRVFCLVFLTLFIVEFILYKQSGKDPGLGGLIMIAYAMLILISGVLDLILSKLLKTKRNWIVQSILIALFFIWTAIH